MKTDKITVADLFEKQRRYLVPLFQRGYVWTLDGQLKPLWRDILNQVEFLKNAKDSGPRAPRRHFLGAVVLNQVNPGVRHVPASEVIDGQQRLTTLQILLTAFRDATIPLNLNYLSAKLRRLTENEGPYPDNSERFKVWPTNAFREDITGIGLAGSAKAVRERYPLQRVRRKRLPRPLLVQGYLFYHEAIVRYLRGEEFETSVDDEGPDPLDQLIREINESSPHSSEATEPPLDADRAELLLETITDHIQLVEISLEGEDDPQIIFETLNARGVPLQPADLIRNYIFLYATRKEEDVNAIYEESWKEFDEAPALVRRSETNRFWKDTERQGRLRSSRLDLFLYHYLTYQTGHDLKFGQIFQEFRDWWEGSNSDRDTAVELRSIRECAATFRSLLVPDLRTRLGVEGYRLKVLDTTTVYPLLLYLNASKNAIGEPEFEGMLTDLESYLIRRAVCGMTPKAYNRIFLGLLNGLRSKAAVPKRSTLQQLMLELSGDSAVWPNDEAFNKELIHTPVYQRLRPAKTRIILEALEVMQHTTKQEFGPLDDPLENPLTIEHIMPRSGSEPDWPEPPVAEDGTPDYEAIIRRERLIHSVGNLTLLTQPLNSSVSNGPFQEKRREIALQSRLQLNSYFQKIADGVDWNESAILERANSLVSLAVKVWPYPTGTIS